MTDTANGQIASVEELLDLLAQACAREERIFNERRDLLARREAAIADLEALKKSVPRLREAAAFSGTEEDRAALAQAGKRFVELNQTITDCNEQEAAFDHAYQRADRERDQIEARLDAAKKRRALDVLAPRREEIVRAMKDAAIDALVLQSARGGPPPSGAQLDFISAFCGVAPEMLLKAARDRREAIVMGAKP